jgi:hypothetical protein
MCNLSGLMREFEREGFIELLKNKDTQREEADELRFLIEKVSKKYGGDNYIFLTAYVEDVVCEWLPNLDQALECFRSLLNKGN